MSNTLEADEAQLASAYAAESRNVLGAEAFIAERRYRQILMAAQSYKRRMLKAKTKFKKASEDVVRFRNSNAIGDSLEQPSTLLQLFCYQLPY
jgi:capsule polysaccharide export protein KpsE/RkpR